MRKLSRWSTNIVVTLLLFSIPICFSILNSYSNLSDRDAMHLEGTYQGENLQIQNFTQQSEEKFCIKEISVNGLHLKDFDKSNVEIDLSGLKIGQYVEIVIEYKTGCKPLVLNPHVLKSKSTMSFITVRADNRFLKWTTNNETTQEPLFIENHRYNKWTVIGKIIGKGTEGYNNYTFPLRHFSGINKYRVKQKDIIRDWAYSEAVEFFNDKKAVQFYPHRVDKVLYFSEKTEYEIFNKYGSLMKKGESSEVIVNELEADMYYLNIDNRTEKFLKK